MTEEEIHLKLSEVEIDNDNLDYIKLTGGIGGKLRDDLVKLFSISDVVERSSGRITVSFFRKVYKQFIDEQISMTKMLELMTEQAHRADVCIRCQRPLDGTNCSKDKCNACFTVNA